MKRSLLYILIMILSVSAAHAAAPPGFVLADNVTPFVPRAIGSWNCTIYPGPAYTLHPNLPPMTVPGCSDPLPPPIPNSITPTTAGTNRIGGSGASGQILYTWDKPIYGIYIMFSGLNTGEYISVSLDTNIFTMNHFLRPWESTFTDCYTLPLGSGPCFINGTGNIEGPACCAGPSNGGTITIERCEGISFVYVFCNGVAGGMNAALYFDTVKPAGCSNAIANRPCEPDPLNLGDVGDSTNATYFWVGPAGFTSTLQYPSIAPTNAALMSGTYKAYKTQTITPAPPAITYVLHDTDSVNVIIHPRAYVKIIGNNGPICENPLDTLHLTATTPGVPGETYSWTGPNLFTSTLENPDIYGFVASDSGTYTITTNTPFGCGDMASTIVVLRPNPDPPKIIGPTPYCYGDPFVPFTTTGVTSGATVLWYTPTLKSPSTTTPPTINTSSAGTTWVYATQTEDLYCVSAPDSIAITVLPKITPNYSWNTILGCDQDAVTFTNTSTGAQWYSWDYGDGTFSSDTTTKLTTQHDFKQHRVQAVTLHAYTPQCQTKLTGYVNTTHFVKAVFSPQNDTFCAGGNTTQNDSFLTVIDSSYIVQPHTGGFTALSGSTVITPVDTGDYVTNITAGTYPAAFYRWDFGDGTFDVTNTRTPPKHRYDSGGVYTVKLTVTDSIGCVDSVSHDVYAIRLFLQSFHDTMLCISQPLPIKVKSLAKPLLADQPYSYSWTPADFLSDTTIISPSFNSGTLPDVTRTYSLTQTQTTYGCFTVDTIRIHAVKGVKLANVTPDASIVYGQSIQLNADSEVIYMWKPNDGTTNNDNINNPVATPLRTTVYSVYGYDKNGCLDSAYVVVTVDSSMIEAVPSGFTPNGDGLNDVFRPVGVKFQNLVDFRVYNRLGQQVFYSNSQKNGWDGNYNGVPQDIGTYTYVVIVAKPGGDGANVIYKGTVTLIR